MTGKLHPIGMENELIQSLKDQIAELKRSWPAHSVPPAMFQELEDLEDELDAALQRVERKLGAEKNSSH